MPFHCISYVITRALVDTRASNCDVKRSIVSVDEEMYFRIRKCIVSDYISILVAGPV